MAQTLVKVTATTDPARANAIRANEAAIANLNLNQCKGLSIYCLCYVAADLGGTNYTQNAPGLLAYAKALFREEPIPPVQMNWHRQAVLNWHMLSYEGAITGDVATLVTNTRAFAAYSIGELDAMFFAAQYLVGTKL